MQLHIPQDYGTALEVQLLMGVNNHIISSQASSPIMGIIQDSLLGSYLLTQPTTIIPKQWFMNCVFSTGDKYIARLPSLFARAKAQYGTNVFNGRVLFSVLFPEDFQYKIPKQPGDQSGAEVVVKNGILISGVIDKGAIGRSHGTITQRLYKEYSPADASEFLTCLQFLVNRWLSYRGFGVGVADFIISKENTRGVQTAIDKAYLEVQAIEATDDPEMIKEFKTNNALNNRGQSLAINGLCPNNRLEVMVKSGSKGNKINIIQITGHLGQNNVEGRRIQSEIDDGQRTLPCFKRGSKHPRCRGFIESSFLKGLAPDEFFMHAKAGREGVINTAVKTRESGYTERKLVKRMEDVIIGHDHTMRSVNNIIDFSYGDSMDPTLIYGGSGASFINLTGIVDKLNADPVKAGKDDFTTLIKQSQIAELDKSIAEYTECVKALEKRKDKEMLGFAKSKLQSLLTEKK